MPITNSRFKPAWWLKNAHLQTIWGTVFKQTPDLKLSSQRFELEDGDFIDVLTTQNNKNKPIVVILHGLEGSIESHYAKPLIQKLEQAGFAVYFMYFRGCSGEVNRLARGYSSGDSADLQAIIMHIKNDQQQSPFAVIGFSLGGNVVLKWLGEQRNNANTSVGVSVSVPFQLADSAVKLESGLSRIYQRYLISSCQNKYLEKEKTLPKSLDINVKELTSFYQFDDKVTAPLSGYKTANNYYEKCSSRQFIKHITKPTLILHSKDDPFMWERSIPTEKELSKNVQLELSEQGGHVGFIYGKFPWKAKYWLDMRIVEWLQEQRKDYRI